MRSSAARPVWSRPENRRVRTESYHKDTKTLRGPNGVENRRPQRQGAEPVRAEFRDQRPECRNAKWSKSDVRS
jgi:hypothetical protein